MALFFPERERQRHSIAFSPARRSRRQVATSSYWVFLRLVILDGQHRQSLAFSERGQLSQVILHFHVQLMLHERTPIAPFESQRNDIGSTIFHVYGCWFPEEGREKRTTPYLCVWGMQISGTRYFTNEGRFTWPWALISLRDKWERFTKCREIERQREI